ncbi:hypothetical protein F5B20DRAFT_538100 [Whalleya microplaca]|nr:hypothetical protein F5B20DRAFT_538100 [Whalleya microplaca]
MFSPERESPIQTLHMSPKLVTVVGATGTQGGTVIAALASDTNYKLRGLTRNPNSPKARELKDKGVEVVGADISDLASLKDAFAGSYAVYGVTDFVRLLGEHDIETAIRVEASQGKNIAQAALDTTSLQHFIWSTLPNASEVSGGQFFLPNFAGKSQVDEFIRSHSDLAAKTTFIFITQYHSNYSYDPLSMYLIPTAHSYVQFTTHPPDTPIYTIGDVRRNLGPFVKPILEQPDKTKGNIVMAHVEVVTAEESLQIWAKVKGVKAISVPVSVELLHALWGKYADVLGVMWRYWAAVGDKSWSANGKTVLTKDDLGVQGLISLAESFEDYEL